MNNNIKTITPSSILNTTQTVDIESELNDTWDYRLELSFILLITILAIPANVYLILFSIKKVVYYKYLRHLIQARIANSFHTYLIEICLFDSIIIVYLILNTSFKVLHYFEKTPFESVYDISNFACKFFTFTVRISGAMSNYLVVFLSLTRFMLFYRKAKNQHEYYRICFNTKYLSIYLFCVCTIANVFRLELLNINNESPQQQKNKENVNLQNLTNNQIMQNVLQSMAQSQCGPNQHSVTFDPNDATNKSLFWSILIYNLLFNMLPLTVNFLLSLYLIRTQNLLKNKLDRLIEWKLGKHNENKSLRQNVYFSQDDQCDQNESIKPGDACLLSSNSINAKIADSNLGTNTPINLKLNVFQVEFLKTCSPCIAFSLTHVILVFPYSLIELVNQIKFNMTLNNLLQYLTYMRYLFFCSKFYLLFIVNYKFRREFFEVFKQKSSTEEFNRNRKFSMKHYINQSSRHNIKKEILIRVFSKRNKFSKRDKQNHISKHKTDLNEIHVI